MNTTSTNEDRELIQAVIETLQQGETLLAEINDEVYMPKCQGRSTRPSVDIIGIVSTM